MTPGTVVEVIAGPWRGRIGTVEAFDPEWSGVAPDCVVVRLHTPPYRLGRPLVERVIVRNNELAGVDLRVREGTTR